MYREERMNRAERRRYEKWWIKVKWPWWPQMIGRHPPAERVAVIDMILKDLERIEYMRKTDENSGTSTK